MTVSIIIPNRNGRLLLETCLAAVRVQETSIPYEVVVVDDASTDDSLSFVRERHPGVRTVGSARNIGFAAACNLGAQHARGELLAFLNSDTRAHPAWLARLHAAVSRQNDVGLATSMIVHMRDRSIDSAGDGYLRCGGAFKQCHGDALGSQPEAVREVFGACGAAFMIRRSLFEALAGFDEDFFMVYEDVDLSYRARLLGASCVLVPDAVVEHAGSATIGNLSTAAVFYGQRNLEWTYFKNTPGSILWRTLPAHLLYGVAAGMGYAGVGHGLTLLRAKVAACVGLPAVWRKRCLVQQTRRISSRALLAQMESGGVRRKWREKRFDWDRAGAR